MGEDFVFVSVKAAPSLFKRMEDSAQNISTKVSEIRRGGVKPCQTIVIQGKVVVVGEDIVFVSVKAAPSSLKRMDSAKTISTKVIQI